MDQLNAIKEKERPKNLHIMTWVNQPALLGEWGCIQCKHFQSSSIPPHLLDVNVNEDERIWEGWMRMKKMWKCTTLVASLGRKN